MALVENMPKGNVVAALAVCTTALMLPKVLPDLSPQWHRIVKSGLSLFLESESDAEGGIIDRLADTALQNALKGLSGPGSAEDRQRAFQVQHAFRGMDGDVHLGCPAMAWPRSAAGWFMPGEERHTLEMQCDVSTLAAGHANRSALFGMAAFARVVTSGS